MISGEMDSKETKVEYLKLMSIEKLRYIIPIIITYKWGKDSIYN